MTRRDDAAPADGNLRHRLGSADPGDVKPAILIIICLVAIQALSNLIADWNKAPEHHTPADDIDEDEIEENPTDAGRRRQWLISAPCQLILLLGMFVLLAIGMPLGFASAFLAVATLMMKFGPDLLFGPYGDFGKRAAVGAGAGGLPADDELRADIDAACSSSWPPCWSDPASPRTCIPR